MRRVGIEPTTYYVPVGAGQTGNPSLLLAYEGKSPSRKGSETPENAPKGATKVQPAHGALDEVFAALCSRCGVEFHLEGDELGSQCRAEIDVAFADLPGARV